MCLTIWNLRRRVFGNLQFFSREFSHNCSREIDCIIIVQLSYRVPSGIYRRRVSQHSSSMYYVSFSYDYDLMLLRDTLSLYMSLILVCYSNF